MKFPKVEGREGWVGVWATLACTSKYLLELYDGKILDRTQPYIPYLH